MKFLKSSILLVALSLGLASTFNASAFTTANAQIEQEPKKEQAKQEIAMKDLPVNVQKDMKEKYPDAEFVTAYKMTSADGASSKYEVVVNNGGKETKLSYDGEAKAKAKSIE